MGVDEDGLNALLDAKLELTLMGEAQEVALQSLAGLMTDLSLIGRGQSPAFSREGVDDFVGGDEPVTGGQAFV